MTPPRDTEQECGAWLWYGMEPPTVDGAPVALGYWSMLDEGDRPLLSPITRPPATTREMDDARGWRGDGQQGED